MEPKIEYPLVQLNASDYGMVFVVVEEDDSLTKFGLSWRRALALAQHINHLARAMGIGPDGRELTA